MKNYNENFIKNSKDPERIKKIVEEQIHEEINKKPYDFLFRFIGENYPKTNHDLLELPGIFKQLESTNIFTKYGEPLQMDLVESIIPDGKTVKYAAVTNMEHQSKKLSRSKKEKIFLYSIFLIGKFKEPCYSYVITNINHGVSEEIYEVDGHPIKIHYVLFDEQRIYKILSTLNQKDYTIIQISEMDFLKLSYCLTFAREPYAKDVIEKSVNLFISIEKIDFEYQLVLFLALKMMIKHHFRDDMVKTRELLTMITKAVSETMIEETPLFKRTQERLKNAQNQIMSKEKEIEEKNTTIQNQNNELAEKNTTIQNQNNELAEKSKEIESLKAEVESLKKKN